MQSETLKRHDLLVDTAWPVYQRRLARRMGTSLSAPDIGDEAQPEPDRGTVQRPGGERRQGYVGLVHIADMPIPPAVIQPIVDVTVIESPDQIAGR